MTHPTEALRPGASSAVDRDRVLRYPDLAARLCEPPIGYANPRQWSGYIPPATYGQQLNTCTRRAALAEIAQAAYERDINDGWTPPLTAPNTDPEQDSNE